MKDLDRRTVMVAGTAAAAGLMASGAFAQEGSQRKGQAGDGDHEAPGLQGGAGAKRTTGPKRWYTATFANAAAMVTFINLAPAQGAGEVVVVGMQGGQISALLYM